MKYMTPEADQVVCYTEPVKGFWQQALTAINFFLPSAYSVV